MAAITSIPEPGAPLKDRNTALLLIGLQRDYFSIDGLLHAAFEDSVQRALENTLRLVAALAPTEAHLISTPIYFTPDYEELKEPIGVLATIREKGAFRIGSPTAAEVPELAQYQGRIQVIPGKRGLNAFSDTALDAELRARDITDVVLAGAVTSLCIDSTARSAVDRGYRVTVLSDCTSARSLLEQSLYCEQIFPMYARVMTSHGLLDALAGIPARPSRAGIRMVHEP